MREQLLGYLLDALEPSERTSVEHQLAGNPAWQDELKVLARALEPLRAAPREYEPSPGLAVRTCEFVMHRAAVTPASAEVVRGTPKLRPVREVVGVPSPSRWTFADIAVAAGIVLAASMILFPAINHSRYTAAGRMPEQSRTTRPEPDAI